MEKTLDKGDYIKEHIIPLLRQLNTRKSGYENSNKNYEKAYHEYFEHISKFMTVMNKKLDLQIEEIKDKEEECNDGKSIDSLSSYDEFDDETARDQDLNDQLEALKCKTSINLDRISRSRGFNINKIFVSKKSSSEKKEYKKSTSCIEHNEIRAQEA
jgi:hypothetical protein